MNDMKRRGYDGFQHKSKLPGISLVCFGKMENDLEYTLMQSLTAFFGSIQEHLPVQPEFSCFHFPDPVNLPKVNQETTFFPLLEQVNGNIILGVTGTGFYSPSRSRFIFGYGNFRGRGLLSSYRFRQESSSHGEFLDRMSKQIIKTLAMACNLGACTNPECIVSYHRWVKDLDRNRFVCDTCRAEIIKSLLEFLRQDDTDEDCRKEFENKGFGQIFGSK
jgi:predicted Zn-dependent protease